MTKRLFSPRIALFVSGWMLPTLLWAQQIQVHGIVKDDTGQPAIGATVFVEGSHDGTITDMDGRFSLAVDRKAKLLVTFLGCKPTTIAIDGRNEINITLEGDNAQLNEVVVVGYGTMRKSDLTGAVGSLSSKDLTTAPVTNIGQAMQGKVAGLQVIDAGKPGDNVSIKIRGLGSINNCDPLVVIDGVPTDLGLNALNMADVERLDVLKDASATAIYGSRGANGVVMITTKKGKDGEGRLSAGVNFAVQQATRKPQLLDAAGYAALNNEMMAASGNTPNPLWNNPEALGRGTNWVDELFKTGSMQNYSLSYSGGTEKNHYYVSGGFLKQSGVIRSVDYHRFTLQINGDAQVKPWLKMTENITLSADRKRQGSYNLSDTYRALPIFDVKDEKGDWTGPEGNSLWYGSIRNPLGPTTTDRQSTRGYNFLGNLTAELSLTSWLKFKSTFGLDAKFWFVDNFTPKYAWKPIAVEEASRYKSDNKSFTYLWDNYFLIDKTFAKNHHVALMAGTSAQWNTTDYLNAQKNIFAFATVHEMDNGEKMYSIGGNETDWALMSYMARLNYDYANRYLLTATLRRDGSSRFGRNHRWGTFPSLSLAWRATEEPWFPHTSWLNDLKVRAGYGLTGSQASVGNYSYLAAYNTSVYPLGIAGTEQSALVSTTLSNPNIHWESVAQTNIGFDAALLNNRITISLDAYIKNTRDMLVKASIPITSGFEDTSTTYTNAGKVRNTGFELTVNTVNLKGALAWNSALSYTYNRNKILDLNSKVPYYINEINTSYATMLEVGYPINVFYGYVTDGLFQNKAEVEAHAIQPGAEPGDIRFKDLDNNGVINDADRTVIGNPNPTHLFSLNNSFTWQGFELGIYFQGVAGNKILNANRIDLNGMSAAYNQLADVSRRWTSEGSSTTMPRAVYGDPNRNSRISDRFVENGSYLRLKSLSLAYNLPSHLLKGLSVENARLTLSCENVFTLTSYSGFDPEVGINGIDLSAYPISRTFNLGFNINF